MELKEVYEKYRHLDIVLSNPVGESFEWAIIRDLWNAIKGSQIQKMEEKDD
jgi:hypothetical protein